MASKGYIIAQVFTAQQIMPLADASVTVTQRVGDKTNLVGFRVTDEDGKTNRIEVDTPDVALSLEPGHEAPFSVFDIAIEHPLYYPVTIRGAQVFGNETTQQRAEMIPIANNVNELNGGPGGGAENIIVTPQNL